MSDVKLPNEVWLQREEARMVRELQNLQQEYMERALPFSKRLLEIREALYPPRITVTLEQARALGLIV